MSKSGWDQAAEEKRVRELRSRMDAEAKARAGEQEESEAEAKQQRELEEIFSRNYREPVQVSRRPKVDGGAASELISDLFSAANVQAEGREQATGVFFGTFHSPILLTEEWASTLGNCSEITATQFDPTTGALIGIDAAWVSWAAKRRDNGED